MKNLICMGICLLALLLALVCTAAYAQEYYTLPEIREQAAQGWHETYTDKYGRVRQVDIDVEVFGEESAPVLVVGWPDDGLQLFYIGDTSPSDAILAAEKGNGVTVYPFDFPTGMKIDLDKQYLEEYENNLTLREMYDFVKEHLQAQGVDQEYVWEQPRVFNIVYSQNKKTESVLVPGYYSMWFWPKYFDLPILSNIADSFVRSLDGPVTSAKLYFDMSNYTEYYGGGTNWDVKEVIAEDIPLKLLHGILHMDDPNEAFQFDWRWLPLTGLSTKDFIAPGSFEFRSGRQFTMGRKLATVCMLQINAAELSDRVLAELLELDSGMVVSLHIQAVDHVEALKMVKRKVTDLDKAKIDEQKKAVRSGYDIDILPSSLEAYGVDVKKLLQSLESHDEHLFMVTFLIMTTADTRKQMENNLLQLRSLAQEKSCHLVTLNFQQEEGLASSLPLGINQVEIQRGLTTSSTGIFVPFTTQELFQPGPDALYTMQRYLQYDALKRNHMTHFDCWASTFGETTTAIELAPEGTGYRARTRFAKFFNMPRSHVLLGASMCSLPKMNNRDSIFDIWIPEPYKSIGQCCLAVAQFRLNICCSKASTVPWLHKPFQEAFPM